MKVTNTLFHGSCLLMKRSLHYWYDSYLFNVKNTLFVGCKCSPVLSFHGGMKVELR